LSKSSFEVTSARVEQYLSGRDRAASAKEVAEFLGVATSTAYGILQLMEVFGTVQKVKRGGRHYYLLKGVHDEEQISAMLPPERVARIPHRKYAPRSIGDDKLPGLESFLGEHLSTMRVRASSGEGLSALAIIGLTQQETAEENIPAEELPEDLEADLEAEERKFETSIKNEPFSTVKHLPKDVRRLTLGQTKHLKEQLKGLDGYEGIARFKTAFSRLSALENGRYGSTLYFSMGTNPWDYVHKVAIDPSISGLMVLPVIDLNRWASWKDFLRGLKKIRIRYGKGQYDRMLDQFMESEHKLVEMTVEDRKASYVKHMLNKRIGERGLEEQIKASRVDEWIYLEKVE
jgi:hypothetical protein